MTPSSSSGRGVALVGYRGTGKSTVGRLLADSLERRFVDADDEFERVAGQSIRDFFAQHGEASFRDLEEELLRSLTADGAIVLATGGGVILRATNRRRLREFGVVVWLAGDPAILADRLLRDEDQSRQRPALTPAGAVQEVEDVLRARTPLYQEVADVTIDTTVRTPRQAADEALAALRGLEAPHTE
jgi:shikimate kinase